MHFVYISDRMFEFFQEESGLVKPQRFIRNVILDPWIHGETITPAASPLRRQRSAAEVAEWLTSQPDLLVQLETLMVNGSPRP